MGLDTDRDHPRYYNFLSRRDSTKILPPDFSKTLRSGHHLSAMTICGSTCVPFSLNRFGCWILVSVWISWVGMSLLSINQWALSLIWKFSWTPWVDPDCETQTLWGLCVRPPWPLKWSSYQQEWFKDFQFGGVLRYLMLRISDHAHRQTSKYLILRSQILLFKLESVLYHHYHTSQWNPPFELISDLCQVILADPSW